MIDDCFYKKLDFDFIEEFLVFIINILDKMYENDEIGVNVYEMFCLINCRLG